MKQLHRQHEQAGFSMVEVLVSIVVLAVGVLGLAGLQFSSLKFNFSSYQVSQGTALAYELADKMRANRVTAYTGAYSFDLANQPSATPAVNCATTNCTPAQIANYDRALWYGRVLEALPEGRAAVLCADTPCQSDSQHQVIVYWADRPVAGVSLASCSVPNPPPDQSCTSIVFQP